MRPTYKQLVQTLRMARYHVDSAMNRANALAYYARQQGMEGNAAQHEDTALASEAALKVIDDVLSRVNEEK